MATRNVGIESGIAFGGWVLCANAVMMVLSDRTGYLEPSVTSALGYAVGALGLVCHVAAIAVSLRAWRRGERAPIIALSYLVLPVLIATAVGLGRYEETQFYRTNPDLFAANPVGDGLDIRDARGVWHVPLSTCPNAVGPRDYIEVRSHEYVVEVLNPSGAPFMRIDAAGRRVECVSGAP